MCTQTAILKSVNYSTASYRLATETSVGEQGVLDSQELPPLAFLCLSNAHLFFKGVLKCSFLLMSIDICSFLSF